MLDHFQSEEQSEGGDGGRTSRSELHVVASSVSVPKRIVRLWEYRPLLISLVRKELSVKYKNSILGFVWSMLNPALTLVIYFVVFQLVLKNGIPQFAVYLLCGLVVWNFFSNAIMGATGSVVANAGIVKKVSFPREVLPLASVGSAMVFFFLQGIVLILALVIARDVPAFSYLPLLLFAFVDLMILSGALAVLLGALNVFYRDTQHLLEIVLMAWFWATPVVYPYQQIATPLMHHGLLFLDFINPMTAIVLTFQRVLYAKVSPMGTTHTVVHLLPANSVLWFAGQLSIVLVVSTILFLIALKIFGRMEGNFAEEL
ncbi:MAG: ABC transporter permease [Actinomycetota bacterium]|nr:ABC transporter permease [Actinomycetota bacterium]